jgi:hypothetical protein
MSVRNASDKISKQLLFTCQLAHKMVLLPFYLFLNLVLYYCLSVVECYLLILLLCRIMYHSIVNSRKKMEKLMFV